MEAPMNRWLKSVTAAIVTASLFVAVGCSAESDPNEPAEEANAAPKSSLSVQIPPDPCNVCQGIVSCSNGQIFEYCRGGAAGAHTLCVQAACGTCTDHRGCVPVG